MAETARSKSRRRAAAAGLAGLVLAAVFGAQLGLGLTVLLAVGAFILVGVFVIGVAAWTKRYRHNLEQEYPGARFCALGMLEIDRAIDLIEFEPDISPRRFKLIHGEWISGNLIIDDESLRWMSRARQQGTLELALADITDIELESDMDGGAPVDSSRLTLKLRGRDRLTIAVQGSEGLDAALRKAGVVD